MQTITEYIILYMRITDAFDLNDDADPSFVELVNKRIDEGWQPLGIPFVISEPDSQRKQLNQAMVKYEKSDIPWQYVQSAPIAGIKE